ncbi:MULTISPECIES: lysozyme inhibitor LprI family protein [Rhodomicrobium]|uniref:lysozyme inhibitor LprI family protein n=1 Tax=Rhodomicrobium TaxID=1068 RepID=UPI000B4A62BC|nr:MULTISPECIES: lysozyme inhibitor LprI family protein [Rhodomicrobium]
MTRFVLAILALLIPPTAHAQSAKDIDCSKAMSTVEMNYCGEKDFDTADKALNEAYQRVIAMVSKSDAAPPYDAKSWETALRQSQRAWVAFREAECNGLVPMEWSGGTGTTSAVLACMTELTKARTKDLDAHAETR